MEEKREADMGSWESDFDDKQKERDTKRLPFMKFDEPADYKIRLVGSHVKFRRHWSPFTQRVITHDSYKSEDPAWQAGFYPKETFAIHIIDRKDGKLKILEKGRSIFKQFARYKSVNDVNPAGKEGPDWVITVEWPNGNKRQANYSATPTAKPAPFTEEEIEMIKEGRQPLKEMYATTPLVKIKELWDALPDEAKVPPKKEDKSKSDDEGGKPSETTSSLIEETMPNAPAEADGDDLFGDDDTGF